MKSSIPGSRIPSSLSIKREQATSTAPRWPASTSLILRTRYEMERRLFLPQNDHPLKVTASSRPSGFPCSGGHQCSAGSSMSPSPHPSLPAYCFWEATSDVSGEAGHAILFLPQPGRQPSSPPILTSDQPLDPMLRRLRYQG